MSAKNVAIGLGCFAGALVASSIVERGIVAINNKCKKSHPVIVCAAVIGTRVAAGCGMMAAYSELVTAFGDDTTVD